MLSLISWTNRGSGGPGDDPDGFIALFGSSAGLARQIVDRAINDWEAVIQNFNYSGGGNTFNLQVTPAAITAIASASITGNNNGKPTSATISIQNTAATHWLDPTPRDDAEFTNNITNIFTAFAPGITGTDFYATIIHEIGHAVGITQNAAVTMASFTTDTGIDDPSDSNPTGGNLLAFNVGGGAVEATFTARDFGHLWEGPATAATNGAGLPVHADELMNPGVAINSNERNLISNIDATILQMAYGYTVAMPSTINNMLVNGNFSTNVLSVLGDLSNANDTISIAEAPGEMVRVSIGNLQELVPLSEINSIVVNSGGGNDNVRFNPLIPPLQPTPVITANLGVGTNTLEIVGVTNGYDSITLNNTTLTSSGVNITAFSGAQALTLYTDGGDADISMPNTPGALTSATIFGGFGGETINLHSLDSLTPVTINALGGDDNITVGASPFASELIRSPVAVFGDDGNDTLFLGSNNGDSIDANVTFNGGTSTSATGDLLVFNDTAPSYNISYDVASTVVTRDGVNVPHTVGYSSVEGVIIHAGSGADSVTGANAVPATVTVNGNNGNDNFIVGGGNLTSRPANFNGGNGTDQITFDDSLDLSPKIWSIGQNQVNFGSVHPLVPLDTNGFESVAILAGMGNDQITFLNDPTQHYSVNGGGGSDQFYWNAVDNWFRDPDNGGAITHYAVNLDGGGGDFDTLLVNDTTRNAPTQYDIDANSLFGTDDTVYAAVLSYARFYHFEVRGSEQDNVFNLTGAAAATNYRLEGRGGADYYATSVDPAATSFPFFNILCLGGTGTDVLNMNDSAFAAPTAYFITSSSIDRTSGAANRYFSLDSIASITVTGTAADDTFGVGGFNSGAGLAINGANGNDTLNFGNNNLASNITSMASFDFDGQAGYNTFNLLSVNDGAGSYARNLGAVSYFNGAGTYSINLSETNTQLMQIYPSSNGPTVSMVGVAPTTTTAVHFNTPVNLGLMSLGVGSKKVTGIQGAVIFDGGPNGSSISVLNGLDTTGRTAHLTQNTLGAFPGDDLFPPGGSLTFTNIKAGSIPGLNLSLGSGADTVYVQPSATGTINITGGNPTTAPGDTLNLILATAQNYVVNGTPANGNVTSTNLKTLSYTGFETGPSISDGNFDGDIDVDGADFLAWQRGHGKPAAVNADGDANNDQDVDGDDLAVWRGQFGVAGAAVAAVSGAVGASSAEPGSTPVGALSAGLVDLAIAQESIRHSSDDRLHRGRDVVDERIVFDGLFRNLLPDVGAAGERAATAQAAQGSRGREQRRGDQFSPRDFEDDRLDAVVLDGLFERLL